MATQAEIIASLPRHLRGYVKEQDYARYTAQDHAVWRFIMRQLQRVLRGSAHPVYFEGLAKTGISLEHIPSIDEMNRCLEKLGWRALVVDGYIPTSVFSEFQMRRILVIAMDMRSIDNLLYTPAPDIVHEAAGHAPFIVDVDYSEYLQRFGEISMKAISTEADHRVYLAVRNLSTLKETRGTPQAALDDAQRQLDAAIASNDQSSEAAKLSRLQWWTIEYGLVGTPDDYELFGAGLLSSLGESVSCRNDAKVVKRPLTVEAIDVAFDITRPQPQLFVAKSCAHLKQVLEVFAESMCFRRGGTESLRTAIASRSVCTAQYNSGLEVTGVFDRVVTDAVGHAIYLHTASPTQLAYRGRQLPGHGRDTHADGFGSPVGRLQGMPRCLSEPSVDELKQHGIGVGQDVRLEFLSGITVEGRLERILREDGRNLLLTFGGCSVTGLDGECLFAPEWGLYDMAVGEVIASVWGGPSDHEAFAGPDIGVVQATPPPPMTEAERRLDDLYAAVRALRVDPGTAPRSAASIHAALQEFPADWLARLELLEICGDDLARPLRAELDAIGREDPAKGHLIAMSGEGR
ncbi:MAG TPA: aromatic amino acid hydroxylase [Nevskiaceae bacterium]|nr:aromatic amino acid hydroxylase [Nevskiaceae bacterium]